jgi:hypothetical protein
MGLWDKIWGGIKAFGGAIFDGLEMAAAGALAGAVAGPVGIVAGAFGGALVGVGMNLPKMMDVINDWDDKEPDAQSIGKRINGGLAAPAISYAAANPNQPESKVINSTLDGVKAGATWRSSYIAAGGHQFGRAMHDGGVTGLVNRASAQMGINPVTAQAHGNGAFRSLIAKTGQSSAHFYGLNDHVLGAAYPVAGAVMAQTNSQFVRKTTPILQPSQSGSSI